MKHYVIALCIMALALVGLCIALDGSDIMAQNPQPNPRPEPCGEQYQTGYELGYQAGKLAAYQEIAGIVNQNIYALGSSAGGERSLEAPIDIDTKVDLVPDRSKFIVTPQEPIPDTWTKPT